MHRDKAGWAGDRLRIAAERGKAVTRVVFAYDDEDEVRRSDPRAGILDPRFDLEFAAFGECDGCLLYTSDAADERFSVDLGGRRIIKKKTQRTV